MSRNVFHVGCVTRVMQNKRNARSTVSFCFRVKANNANLKVDLYFNNDPIDSSEDRKLLSQIGIQDKMVSCHCNIIHSNREIAHCHGSMAVIELSWVCGNVHSSNMVSYHCNKYW